MIQMCGHVAHLPIADWQAWLLVDLIDGSLLHYLVLFTLNSEPHELYELWQIHDKALYELKLKASSVSSPCYKKL